VFGTQRTRYPAPSLNINCNTLNPNAWILNHSKVEQWWAMCCLPSHETTQWCELSDKIMSLYVSLFNKPTCC